MGLHLDDAAIIAAAYEFFRCSRPCRGWKLPPADDMEFRIVADPTRYGWHDKKRNKPHVIAASAACIGYTDTLFRTVAHEICHIRADAQGERSLHGAKWKAAARQLSARHGYDWKAL